MRFASMSLLFLLTSITMRVCFCIEATDKCSTSAEDGDCVQDMSVELLQKTFALNKLKSEGEHTSADGGKNIRRSFSLAAKLKQIANSAIKNAGDAGVQFDVWMKSLMSIHNGTLNSFTERRSKMKARASTGFSGTGKTVSLMSINNDTLNSFMERRSKMKSRTSTGFSGTGKTVEVAKELSIQGSKPFSSDLGKSMVAGAGVAGQLLAGGSVDPVSAAMDVGLPLLSMANPMLGLAVSIGYSFVSGFLGESEGPMETLYNQIMDEVGEMIQTANMKSTLESQEESSVALLKEIMEEMDWIPNMLDEMGQPKSPAKYIGCFHGDMPTPVKVSRAAAGNNPESCRHYCDGHEYTTLFEEDATQTLYACACFAEWPLTAAVSDEECAACVPAKQSNSIDFVDGTLAGRWQVVGDYVELPEGGGAQTSDTIEFDIMCTNAARMAFDAYVNTPNGNADSVKIKVGKDGVASDSTIAWESWNLGTIGGADFKKSSTSGEWKTSGAGAYKVVIAGREDGVKLKRLVFHNSKYMSGNCWFHTTPSSPRPVLAASGKLSGTVVNAGGYVDVPKDEVKNGQVSLDLWCSEASSVKFQARKIVPDTASDSVRVRIGSDTQTNEWSTWFLGHGDETWSWSSLSPTLEVSAGHQVLLLYERESGLKFHSFRFADGYGSKCTFPESNFEFEFVGRGGCHNVNGNSYHTRTYKVSMADCQTSCEQDLSCMAFEHTSTYCEIHYDAVTGVGDQQDYQCWKKVVKPPDRCGTRTQHAVYAISSPLATKIDRDSTIELSYYAIFQNQLATARSAFWLPSCVTHAEKLLAGSSSTKDEKCKEWQEMGTVFLGLNQAVEHLLTLLNIAIIKPVMREGVLERFRSVGALYMVLALDSYEEWKSGRMEAVDPLDPIGFQTQYEDQQRVGGWTEVRNTGGVRRRTGPCNFRDSWSGSAVTVSKNVQTCGVDFSSVQCVSDWTEGTVNSDAGFCGNGCTHSSQNNCQKCKNFGDKLVECRQNYIDEEVGKITDEVQPLIDKLEALVDSANYR